MQYHIILKRKENFLVSKNIHSVFFEYFGNTVYDGIWVGKDSEIENIDGLRKDVIDGIREMGIGTMRWPGGCCADHYHWKNGIGKDREDRYFPMPDPANGDIWRMDFGTDEFLKLCELTGAEPVITVNTATGTPEEFLDWHEYVNGNVKTKYGKMRAENGHPEPYNVKYWGIGNTDENVWHNDWNHPETYAQAYLKFQTVLRDARRDKLFFIGLGLSREAERGMQGWTNKVLDYITADRKKQAPDALSVHYYLGSMCGIPSGGATEYTDEEYFVLLDALQKYQHCIDVHRVAISEHAGKDAKTKICFDEWGAWHKDASPENNQRATQTLRDGIYAALALHIFYKNADIVEFAMETQMTNLIQSLFETDGEKFYKTPTFYVMKLLFPHTGQYLLPTLPTDIDDDLDTVSTLSEDGTKMTVSIVNRHLYDAKEINLSIAADGWTVTTADIVTCDDVRAQNSYEDPERICDKPFDVPENLAFTVPKHSIVRICLEKK